MRSNTVFTPCIVQMVFVAAVHEYGVRFYVSIKSGSQPAFLFLSCETGLEVVGFKFSESCLFFGRFSTECSCFKNLFGQF